ncbi:MAG TPA: nitric-oxide reductase large subunit, partial [Rhodanobacteraceae bacterium]|nr:nitric-oxide reductase large subunit [Rhodanobacteraceae bacterium]
MSTSRRLWVALIALLAATFAVLLWMGGEIHRAEPPMPERVVGADGQTLFTREAIEQGRVVWQSIGGQQMGTIWGHGALVAPDWSADWLHRESTALLDLWAQREHQVAFA